MDSTLARKLWAAVAAVSLLAVCAASVPAHGAGYVRPKGASPLHGSLVPVFERCQYLGGRTADSTHGGPLSYPSCLEPELVSGTLTIGTPDSNGLPASSLGYFTYTVMPGKPSTPQDEADVRLDVKITDVRLQSNLTDYPGELELEVDSIITDSDNGPGENEAGTLPNFFYYATIPCFPTPDQPVGSTCELHTTVDTLVPDTIKEGKRMIWGHADHTHIFDGGPDWRASTRDDNLAFMTWGLFIP